MSSSPNWMLRLGISVPLVLQDYFTVWNNICFSIFQDVFQTEWENMALRAHSGKALPHDVWCFARSVINCCLLCCFVQNGSSNGELLIKSAQLKHAGRYTCTAQTPIDNVTASAHLVVRGESWVVQLQYTYAYSHVYKCLKGSENTFS